MIHVEVKKQCSNERRKKQKFLEVKIRTKVSNKEEHVERKAGMNLLIQKVSQENALKCTADTISKRK